MLTSEPVLEWKKRAKGDENMQKRIRTMVKNKDFALFFEVVSGYNDECLAHAEKWEKEAKEAWEREFDLEDRLERGGQHVPRMAICESKDRAMHKLMVERDRYKEQLEKVTKKHVPISGR